MGHQGTELNFWIQKTALPPKATLISSISTPNIGYRAFAVSGPQFWNSHPLDVRQSRDNLLLFNNHFDHW